jgi:PAS domain S-box-containing protein
MKSNDHSTQSFENQNYQFARSLIEASLDPLMIINQEGKISDMNQATEDILGLERKDILGSRFNTYFSDPQLAKAIYKKVFSENSVWDAPLTIMHQSGKQTEVLINGSLYQSVKGNIQVVVVARDISHHKRIELELTEARVFAEKATKLAEEAQLKAEMATKMATDAVKSKQQFLSNMSHEIRTPMNAIIGFTKVLMKSDLTDKQSEYLSAIKISGDSLIVLINDILDLAKVDAGKMIFEQLPFSIKNSIPYMLHLFETKFREKDLKLVIDLDERIPEVLIGDQVRLHQIILNLVSNALKFTLEGSIIVSAKLISQNKKQTCVEFSVKDTGIGIPKTKLHAIFENFQQATSETSRLFGGTGLGLAIVKQLVEGQGGTVKVESEISEGSTFSFMLKFCNSKLKVLEEKKFETPILEANNIKILVVEDIPINQLLMKTLLDDFGFQREIAANGKIAIQKLEKEHFDIILMDLQMQEMNGFETTAYIRNVMKSNIPIIAVTADVTTSDVIKCKEVGMNDYMSKPLDERILYTKIMEFINQGAYTPYQHEVATELKIKRDFIVDLQYLATYTKSNLLMMKEIILAFLEQTPPLILIIKKSFLEKDWITLQAAIHKMLPSFSIVGMDKEFELMAKKLQEYAQTKEKSDEIQVIVSQLEHACNLACKELKEEYNRINLSKK